MRKLITILAVSSGAAFFCVPAAHADEVVGGPKLAGHGYIWDHSSGVPAPPHIQASSYVIADLETGRVLAAKDPHGHYRPASTLKTLTAITLIPRLDPAKTVQPSRAAVDVSGSAVGLSTYWKYTVRDLFYGLLMQSGNDAAIALCEANGGLRPTLDQMNAEARRIQALDTVARTPNGLDDDPPLTLEQQHSSAYDLALIMKQGLKLPDFRKYVSRTLYDWPAPPTKKEREKGKKTGGWQISTHDHLLLGDRYPGMIGGKNGWTSHALGSFVGAATRNGHTIIIALMHAQSDFWGDARSLLNWGFAERAKVGAVGTLVDPLPPPRPRPAHTQAAAKGRPAAAHAFPGDGRTWWLPVGAGVGAALVLAVAASLFVGLRRRARPGAAGPPDPAGAPGTGPPGPGTSETRSAETGSAGAGSPDTASPGSASRALPEPGAGHVRPVPATSSRQAPADPGTAAGERDDGGLDAASGEPPAGTGTPRARRPRGDVKVAGPRPSGDGPPPRETAPNPVQPGEHQSDEAGRTVGDDRATTDDARTVRAPGLGQGDERTVRDARPTGADAEPAADAASEGRDGPAAPDAGDEDDQPAR